MDTGEDLEELGVLPDDQKWQTKELMEEESQALLPFGHVDSLQVP